MDTAVETALLSVDCGGTKCDMLLIDQQSGKILAQAHGSAKDFPNMVYRGGIGRSDEMVDLVFARLIEKMSGHIPETINAFITNFPEQALSQKFRRSKIPGRVKGGAESRFAIALSGKDEGICVLVGTGAVSTALRKDEKLRWHCDGLGPQLGDSGSAYSIGLETLRRMAVKVQLGYQESCKTWARLMITLGLPEDTRPSYFCFRLDGKHIDRSVVASISRFTEELALEGDSDAIEILEQATLALSRNVAMIIEKSKFAEQPSFPVVGLGSVITNSQFVWPRLCEEIKKLYPHAEFIRPPYPMVVGGIFLGLKTYNQTDSLKNFQEEIKKYYVH